MVCQQVHHHGQEKDIVDVLPLDGREVIPLHIGLFPSV
jgi:hypothetical protein